MKPSGLQFFKVQTVEGYSEKSRRGKDLTERNTDLKRGKI